MIRRFVLAACFAAIGHASALDVYFEESHAGSFYHLASTLPLDEPHTLVLVDSHNDASAIAGSDRIREAIRNVPSAAARDELFARWRKQGAIQCYDWIEPLLPLPFEKVVWIAPTKLNPLELARQQTIARENLDGLLEAFPRTAGELSPRFHALSWTTLAQRQSRWSPDKKVVASLDLDYFADCPDGTLDSEFERVFSRLLALPGLRALTISLSSPWLRDEAQAERLAVLALEAATSLANARVHFAPFANAGPDRSRRAKEFLSRNAPVPRLDLTKAGPALRSLLLARRSRLLPDTRLAAQLDTWSHDPFQPRASVDGEIPDPYEWYRLDADRDYVFRVRQAEGAHIRWFALVPDAPSTNVAGLMLGFAENAPRFVRRIPKPVGEGPELSSTMLAPLLEPTTRAGTALLFATADRHGGIARSNELALTFRAGSGFRGALSEQFARPYSFGCGLVPGGPNALVANDCANFMIAGLRREGWLVPWGNPKQFADHLEEVASWKRSDPFPSVTQDHVGAGAFIHFGNHVAAVWKDRAPFGQLDESDLVVHHLESFPEVVPLGTLLKRRDQFRLMRFRPEPHAIRLIFGGDVMLGSRVSEAIDRAANPFTHLAPTIAAADYACVNLECVASNQGEPAPGRKFHFRAHERAPNLLAEAGIDAVSVANNHAHDFGPAAFADSIRRLTANGLQCADGSQKPVTFTIKGSTFALFACNESADANLLAAIREAAAQHTVIVMPHWGTEHTTQPNEGQRQLAKQFAGAGAKLIIGSGPHAQQPVDFVDGAVVAWSLGNLIFDGPGPDLAWSRGTLLEVHLTKDGVVRRLREHRVNISPDGTARLQE